MNLSTIYHAILRRIIKASFPLWQWMGFHLTENRFGEPVPDTRELKNELWSKPAEVVGVSFNEESQLATLELFASRFKREYDSLPRHRTTSPHEYYVDNEAFGSVDGEILYCVIRHFKPGRIFEAGSGYSTYLAAQAFLKNKEEGNHDCELIAFEPSPTSVLKTGFPGLAKLVPSRIEDVPKSEFAKLQENDILFIDSTHVLKIGGDVNYMFLEILPRLNKGVLAHVHDIFLPAEYPKQWILKEHRFWTEQYLLQAFLSFNDAFEVVWAGSFMHLKHPDVLERAFASYNRNDKWPGSFWIRKRR